MDCIFCNIAKKEAPAEMVYEDNDFVAFPDIHPKADVHLLVIPRKHIVSLHEVREGDAEFMGRFLLAAQKVAREKQLKGYRLEMYVGKEGGQIVDHIHLHILANHVV